MSATRLGRNWADVDEEDDEDVVVDPSDKSRAARCFETPVDAQGIKTVIEYKERDGKTYKVTKRVRQNTVTQWTNAEMLARKNMEKFGKVIQHSAEQEAQHTVRQVESVEIEVCRKAVIMSQANEAEDKFYEEALKNCENLFKEKKVWSDMNRDKQSALDSDAPAPAADAPAAAAPAAEAPGGPAKYVPPSVRAAAGAGGKGDGKGGKGGDPAADASLRITNLSEEAKEGDLQELFGQFGRLQRVYMAKDLATGLGKGFAFVTYYNKEDAQKAINKLNGHGYDNLIMQVQVARPKA